MSKRRDRGFTEALRDVDLGRRSALFRGLSGLVGADVTGKFTGTNLRSMLAAAFGPGKRGAEVDTRAASQKLGVSQRTVERWVRGEVRKPKPEALDKLTKASRQAASTKAGRAKAIDRFRNSPAGKKIGNYGAQISVRGRQGVAGGGGWYIRQRTITIPPNQDTLAPEAMEGLWQAYVDGGDKGVSTYLTGLADEHYLGDWTFESIDEVSITPP